MNFIFKKYIVLLVSISLLFTGCTPVGCTPVSAEKDEAPDTVVIEKPMIYMYGYNSQVTVKLQLDANTKIVSSYPAYPDDGWKLFSKNGTFSNKYGREYYGLFYEVETSNEFDFDSGFCFEGKKSRDFLEIITKMLGLNAREANEFIVYWLPEFENNKYNVVSFQTTAWQKSVKLSVEPAADITLRVCMAWYASDKPVSISRQKLRDLSGLKRQGKIVVEWGGFEDKKKTYEHTAHEEDTFYLTEDSDQFMQNAAFGPHTITDKYGVTYTFSEEEWAILLDAWGWAGAPEFFIEKQAVEDLKNIIALRRMGTVPS